MTTLSQANMTPTAPYRVLVVDDSVTVRKFVKRAVELSGVAVSDVLEASDGGAAFALLEAELAAGRAVHLVLTDLHMPGTDGYTLIRSIRGAAPLAALPVVVLSAEPDGTRLAGLQSLGVRRCLRKPFAPEAVRDILLDALEAKHAA